MLEARNLDMKLRDTEICLVYLDAANIRAASSVASRNCQVVPPGQLLWLGHLGLRIFGPVHYG